MEGPAIFSATLGLSPPWRITQLVLSETEKRMDIGIDVLTGGTFTCPVCGAAAGVCKTEKETWHHDNFFLFKAYLHARVPHLHCSTCGVHPMQRPWAAGSKFCLME